MKQIAFLRAINVGGRVVKMEWLRKELEALRLQNVGTWIQSGNVIFESRATPARIESAIEKMLHERLGYEVPTFIRSFAELTAICRRGDDMTEGERLYVGFLRKAPPSPVAAAVALLSNDDDTLSVSGREIYWFSRTSFSESLVSSALIEKTLGAPCTLRNVTTLRKIVAKYG